MPAVTAAQRRPDLPFFLCILATFTSVECSLAPLRELNLNRYTKSLYSNRDWAAL